MSKKFALDLAAIIYAENTSGEGVRDAGNVYTAEESLSFVGGEGCSGKLSNHGTAFQLETFAFRIVVWRWGLASAKGHVILITIFPSDLNRQVSFRIGNSDRWLSMIRGGDLGKSFIVERP